MGGLLRSLRALREQFGNVQVSFGEPIRFESVLDSVHPVSRHEALEEPFRPEWVTAAVEQLGAEVLTAINAAAVINPVNLVALVMLSMPKQAIVEGELEAQLELYRKLFELAPHARAQGDATSRRPR